MSTFQSSSQTLHQSFPTQTTVLLPRLRPLDVMEHGPDVTPIVKLACWEYELKVSVLCTDCGRKILRLGRPKRVTLFCPHFFPEHTAETQNQLCHFEKNRKIYIFMSKITGHGRLRKNRLWLFMLKCLMT